MMSATRFSIRAGQRGASLVLTIVILAALTLLGVGAVTVSRSNIRLAVNLQFQNAAQNEAESALARAESWLYTNSKSPAIHDPAVPAVAGLLKAGTVLDDHFAIDWDDQTQVARIDAAAVPSTDPGFEEATANPNQAYVIELFAANRTLVSNSAGTCNTYNEPAPCPQVDIFRVTARGQSRLGASRIVQTLFVARH
jgi:hypothetical protein